MAFQMVDPMAATMADSKVAQMVDLSERQLAEPSVDWSAVRMVVDLVDPLVENSVA